MKKKEEDTYYLFKEYNTKEFVAKVYRPVLTEEERERRMKKIRESTMRLMEDVYESRRKGGRPYA